MRHAPPPTLWRVAVLGVFLLLQLSALAGPDIGSMDGEEAYNASHAVALGWSTGLEGLGWQYRPFCGGCTVGAALAHPVLALLGDTALAWKLSLLPWGLAWALATLLLAEAGGRDAERAAALLVCLAPLVLLEASLRGWLNHYESAALALLAVAVARRDRPLLAGLLAGGAVWVGLSALPVLAGLVIPAVVARRGRALAWTALGASWMALPFAAQWAVRGDLPFALGSALAGAHVPTVPEKLLALVEPARLGAVLGVPGASRLPGLLFAVAVTIAAVVGLRERGRGLGALLAALGAWLLAYTAGPFGLGALGQGWLQHARYLVPPVMLAVPLLAVAAGALAERGWRRSALALVLAGATTGVAARAHLLDDHPTSTHLATPATDWLIFAQTAGASGYPPPRSCPPDSPRCAEIVAFLVGVKTGRTPEVDHVGATPPTPGTPRAPWLAGLGHGRGIAARDTDPAAALRGLLPTLPPVSSAERTLVLAHAALARPERARERLDAGALDDDDEGRILAWAAGAWNLHVDRAPRDLPTAPGPVRTRWAQGQGLAFGGRYGATTRPEGFDRWPPDLQADFATGVLGSLRAPWFQGPPGPRSP